MIEVIKTKEYLYAFNYIKLFLVVDYSCLLKVDFNTIRTNNKTKIFYTSYSKITFTDICL